jgi:hypothetical protein
MIKDKLTAETEKVKFELSNLDRRINLLTISAWMSVGLGGLIMVGSVGLAFLFEGENLKTFGDFLGESIGAIWSMAGLFFIYVAFIGQKQQMLHQYLEMKQNEQEVARNRQTLESDRFERAFFQLISMHAELVRTIDIRNKKTFAVISSGKDCFRSMHKKLNDAVYSTRMEKLPPETVMKGGVSMATEALHMPVTSAEVITCYEKIFRRFQGDLSQYFSNFLNIVQFVEKSEQISQNEKENYLKLFMGQFSPYELALLYYHGLSKHGEKLKMLLQKYKLLRNLNLSHLFNESDLISETYSMNAFGFTASGTLTDGSSASSTTTP